MADKAISELTAAEQIKSTDMFVLEQDGTAKRLQGQVLLNWLTAAADGHGGISDISKTGTNGLVDIYTITLADTTTKTFTVTNGNGLTDFEKISTEGLVDTYRFTRTDGTYFIFSVANGAKGDRGDDWYVWIKYASQEPTEESHDIGNTPDDWMGVYSGTASEAPTDWKQYTWQQVKGDSGATVQTSGLFGFDVDPDSGQLRLFYTGSTPPDFTIDADGHLIYKLSPDVSVDIGKVSGADGPKGDPGITTMTQAAYDAAVAAGTIDADTWYGVYEEG